MADKSVPFGDGTLTARAVESTVDVANNRSLVLVSLILSTFDTWYGFHDGSASVSVNGGQIGSASGSTTDQPSTGGTKTIISNAGVWVTHDANGQATVSFSGHLTWPQFPKNVDTGNGSLTLSDIVRPPSAPSAVTAARVSDSQISVSWTNNSTAHHEYSGINVYRSTDGGGYALIASLGVVASYSDTTVSANHKYVYKVEATNAAGSAQSSASSAAYTTPGAPTSCAAAKQPNNDVVVTWSNHVTYSEYTTRIEESIDGGAFAEITSVSGGVTSYTAVAPDPAHTHRYRVRARSTTGALNSGYSTSATVTLLATANPPTGLAPSGVARDATEAIVLTWTHNPADGTPQSKYLVEHSIDGGSTWTTVGPTTSGVSSYTLPAGTVANGQTVTWHVKTAGQNGTLSAFSASASFTTSARPTATISAPTSPYNSSHLTASWTYFQAQSSAQAAFLAQLYDGSGDLLEQVTGTSGSSAAFTTPLVDGGSYSVSVAVTSAAGLDSVATTQAFTVTFLPPAAVTIAAAYDPDTGSMVLTLAGENPVGGVTVAIATVGIERQVDGGAWVRFVDGIVLDAVELTAAILDTTPTIHGLNSYRAVAFSDLPSSATSAAVDVTTAENRWSFVNYGPGFASRCRLRTRLALPRRVTRARARYHFAGRKLPVQLTGEAVDREMTVSAMLFEGASTVDEFEAMAETEREICWRDPTGRRIFASVGQVRPEESTEMPILSDGRVGASISFDLAEVDYAESVGS